MLLATDFSQIKPSTDNYTEPPNHKAKFDVTTGKVVSGPRVLLMHPKIKDEPTYAVKVEGKDILLERD